MIYVIPLETESNQQMDKFAVYLEEVQISVATSI